MIDIRTMLPGESQAVCEVVIRTFNEFVAPGYSAEGLSSFYQYVTPEALEKRLFEGHFILVAFDTEAKTIVGAIEVRNHNHISLLFVDKAYHRQRIARQLFGRALNNCYRWSPIRAMSEGITVNSSPYAVPIYEKLGFKKTGDEQVKNGIRFVPMIYNYQK